MVSLRLTVRVEDVIDGGVAVSVDRDLVAQDTRTYTVEPAEDGQVRFRMEERFTGLFSGPISKSIPDLQPSFDQFARDLPREDSGKIFKRKLREPYWRDAGRRI